MLRSDEHFIYFEASALAQRSIRCVYKVSRINEGVFNRKHVNSEIETEYNYYYTARQRIFHLLPFRLYRNIVRAGVYNIIHYIIMLCTAEQILYGYWIPIIYIYYKHLFQLHNINIIHCIQYIYNITRISE